MSNLGNTPAADQAIYSLIQQSFCPHWVANSVPIWGLLQQRVLVFVLTEQVDNDTSVKCYEGKISHIQNTCDKEPWVKIFFGVWRIYVKDWIIEKLCLVTKATHLLILILQLLSFFQFIQIFLFEFFELIYTLARCL